MIRNHDRSGWFGCSDTATVMGNWNTKTFAKWWGVKTGLLKNDYTTTAMQAGTHYEHRILDACGIRKRDRQIKFRSLRLRVNLDGEDKTTVYEIKTHGSEFKLSKAYWQQCQVEMFATGKKCVLIAYRLTEDDYQNYFNPIDPDRIQKIPVEYDPVWIQAEYLPRLRILCKALKERRHPNEICSRQRKDILQQ
jgi:hypothetical protein